MSLWAAEPRAVAAAVVAAPAFALLDERSLEESPQPDAALAPEQAEEEPPLEVS